MHLCVWVGGVLTAYLVCGMQYAYLSIILLQQLAPPCVSFSLKRAVRSNNDGVSSVYLRKCGSYSLLEIISVF